MATHFGKEGVVTAGGTGIGELTGYTLETTADVVEDTQLSDATKSLSSATCSAVRRPCLTSHPREFTGGLVIIIMETLV